MSMSTIEFVIFDEIKKRFENVIIRENFQTHEMSE